MDVHVEDGFARTTIDQTYFNHQNTRLEGTFYFPLPPDASLSRLAMYVDGQRMEGGMAERDYARTVYETAVPLQPGGIRPVTVTPCLVCESCRSIEAGTTEDPASCAATSACSQCAGEGP